MGERPWRGTRKRDARMANHRTTTHRIRNHRVRDQRVNKHRARDHGVSNQVRTHPTMLALGASVGGFLFGYDTSTMNAAVPGIRTVLALDAGSVGFLAAIGLIGCAVGAWMAGPAAARYGRTRIMLIAGAVIAVGSLAVAASSRLILMGAFRLATGMGIGAASAVVPGYIAEISPTEIRGRLGTFWQFAIVVGQLAGLVVGYVMTRWAGSEGASLPWGGAAWRWMFVAAAVLAIVYVPIARLLPPPPVQYRVERRPLSELRGPRLGLQGVVWTGLLLAAFQQLVGISVVKTYSNTIWQAVGAATTSAFTISMVTVVISILSTVVAIAMMDRVGRRTLLTIGAAAMTVALAGLALCFSMATDAGEALSLGRGPMIGALVAMNLFAIAFGMTWGPVMWLMVNELFDSRLRITAVAVCTAGNWLTNWLVVRTFPLLAEAGLGLAYGLFALFAGLAFLFAFRVLPETRGTALR
jgi:MFS transporter, SP family, sugar:H+ symporter